MLCLAMLGGAAIIVAAVFIGIKISATAGVGDPPPPPPPPPISPVKVEIKSTIQMSLLFLESQKCKHADLKSKGMKSEYIRGRRKVSEDNHILIGIEIQKVFLN